MKSFLTNLKFCKEFEHVTPGTLGASYQCTDANALYVINFVPD